MPLPLPSRPGSRPRRSRAPLALLRDVLPVLLLALAPPLRAQDAAVAPEDMDLTELSLEELLDLDVEVSSVSRKTEPIARTAAAVHVITAEDLRRSGARSIPEALRMVPGVQVARLNASDWAVSARGFNDEFSNKMLVLIDGRSIYTELFSGVFWSTIDLPIEEIERIEVIRGPGGTAWGTNAVNGVINIITKPAGDSEGGTVRLRTGTEDRIDGMLRASGAIGENAHLRVYTNTRGTAGHGSDANDLRSEWDLTGGGFRADWARGDDRWTIVGDGYRSDQVQATNLIDRNPPYYVLDDSRGQYTGGSLLLRWSRQLDSGGEVQLQSSYAATSIDNVLLGEVARTFDVDWQHRIPVSESQEVVWGLAFRHTTSETSASPSLEMVPADETYVRASAFVMDELTLSDDLSLTLGTKVEHHDFTGMEVLPSARLAWAVSSDDTLWAAVSRAARTPSLTERNIHLQQGILPDVPPGFDTIITLVGDSNAVSEDLIAYELGWRSRLDERTSLDVATFLHDYDHLLGYTLGDVNVIDAGTLEQELDIAHLMHGIAYGVETSLQHRFRDDWMCSVGYSFLVLDLEGEEGLAQDPAVTEDLAPRNQAYLRSMHDLSDEVQLDLSLYYVDHVGENVPAYVRGDVRLGWRPTNDLAFTLGVENLFHDGDLEFPDGNLGAYEDVATNVHLGITWSF